MGSNYKFKASKYYFMIFKNKKIVAYTDEERLVHMYMQHRNKFQYETRIYKFIDLPGIIKEKIYSGEWDKELVLVGCYGQCCMTMADEIKFIDHISEFRYLIPTMIYEMENLLGSMKFDEKEYKSLKGLFKEFHSFINEIVIDDNASDEEIFSFEAFEKYLIKIGVI